MRRFYFLWLFLLVSLSTTRAQAELVIGGNALIQFDGAQLLNQTGLTPVWYYDANNGAATATSSEIFGVFSGGGFQGGGAAVAPAAIYNFNHPILLGPVSDPTGRDRQETNADLDPSSPLTTWSAGERIGIDGVTVFAVGASGIAAGDYSLEYSTGRLSLVNHLGGTVEAFRVNNPTFTTTATGFLIEGDLLTGTFFSLNGLQEDLDVGYFSFNAITAVPEPSTMVLLGLAAAGLGAKRLVRRTKLK